jgi:excisionase family DNA binding protein
MTPAIQKRASSIFKMPTPDTQVAEMEKRLNKLAYFIAQKDIEDGEWRKRIEDYLLNRTLSPNEASKMLKITADAVRRNIMEGRLGGGKDGGRWKTTYNDVLAYMQERPKKFGHKMTLMDIVEEI